MVMRVVLRKILRAWRFFALSTGDVGAVYGYNRVRNMITVFHLVECALGVWSYFDDSAILDTHTLAESSWFIFLRTHALLIVPIKGNPLSADRTAAPMKKLFPPAASNPFLGEQAYVETLPCTVEPTESRRKSTSALIGGIRATRRLHPGEAASVFGKARFYGESLHGRVGLPALQALSARQHESTSALTPVLLSSLSWIEDLSSSVAPRTWPSHRSAPAPIRIFGDASEPDVRSGQACMLGGVLLAQGAPMRHFEVPIPYSIIVAFPKRAKRIYYYELLWPAVTAFIWRDHLAGLPSIFFDDNEGAKFRLISGFSPDFAASTLLALFWGASAAQQPRPWIMRATSAEAWPLQGPLERFSGRSHRYCTALGSSRSTLAPQILSESTRHNCVFQTDL